MRKSVLAGLVLTIALVALLQTSCGKREGEHTFVKLYTSCNLMGSLEPCG